jgi:hypothetical protein
MGDHDRWRPFSDGELPIKRREAIGHRERGQRCGEEGVQSVMVDPIRGPTRGEDPSVGLKGVALIPIWTIGVSVG